MLNKSTNKFKICFFFKHSFEIFWTSRYFVVSRKKNTPVQWWAVILIFWILYIFFPVFLHLGFCYKFRITLNVFHENFCGSLTKFKPKRQSDKEQHLRSLGHGSYLIIIEPGQFLAIWIWICLLPFSVLRSAESLTIFVSFEICTLWV
jgi:hypothetical protein